MTEGNRGETLLKAAGKKILRGYQGEETARFTHPGTGTVRMCPALPKRSAITQCTIHWPLRYAGPKNLTILSHRPVCPNHTSYVQAPGD
jgi:hypothetical protein